MVVLLKYPYDLERMELMAVLVVVMENVMVKTVNVDSVIDDDDYDEDNAVGVHDDQRPYRMMVKVMVVMVMVIDDSLIMVTNNYVVDLVKIQP